MKSAIVAAVLLLSTSVASAQSVNVFIVRHVEDLPLSQVVGEIAEIGSILSPLAVTVEPALAAKRITTDLKHPIIGALQAVARAAGGHLWKLGAGSYAVRAKAPPPSKLPPKSELVDPLFNGGDADEEEPVEEEPAVPRPEWEQRIQKALDETPFAGNYRKTHLRKILLDMAGQAGVPLHIDPEILRTKTRKELTLDYEHPLEGSPSVDEVLTIFCGFQHTPPDFRWGVVFITTLKRALSLPENVFLDTSEELPADLKMALDETLVSCRLKNNSIKKAMENMSKEGKLEIQVDPEAVKLCRKLKFTIEFKERRLVDALSILLIPEGLGLALEQGCLVVKPLK
jgi:hypothetical protein